MKKVRSLVLGFTFSPIDLLRLLFHPEITVDFLLPKEEEREVKVEVRFKTITGKEVMSVHYFRYEYGTTYTLPR